MRPIRFTTSARKHRIGKARAIEAMQAAGEPSVISGGPGLDDRLLFIGVDSRGIELEIIALDVGDALLVIHVMPYAYRRRSDDDR